MSADSLSLPRASYRDLLGTARTIIDINGQLQGVETLLGEARAKADTRVFEKVAANCAEFERRQKVESK